MGNILFERFLEAAQSSGKRKKIVFPEVKNEKILKAAATLYELGVCHPVFVGKEEVVKENTDQLGISAEGFQYFDNEDTTLTEKIADEFLNITDLFSKKTLQRKAKDPLNFAAMLTRTGYADCLAAGADYSTGDVIFAAQSFIGTAENISQVSSLGISYSPQLTDFVEDGLLAWSDCGVCIDPNPEELADIAIVSAQTASRLLGKEARVALLSFSTKGSGDHEKVEKVRKALEIARTRRPDLKIDGEFQIDAAIIPAAAEKKVKEPSEVAGKANVLIVPNLEVGNIVIKLIGFASPGGGAYGPFLQGFQYPVADFSRTATEEEILTNLLGLIVRA